MAITLDGTSGITAPTYGGTVTGEYSVPVTAFKNRLINGACMIDQRNAGASVSLTANPTYTLDRWVATYSQISKFTVQRNSGSVTPPSGFTNYLGCVSASAYTVGAAEVFNMQQRIEGFNIADLGWGAAGASAITLSFWARSSLTGTFGGALQNDGASRSYPFSYTINSANTWEYKTITVAGDTTGTWVTNSGVGLQLIFSLGAGSTYSGTAGSWSGSAYYSATGATSVVGTNGATFYITGVQLEKGSTATSFDYRPYGTELALCQRYYWKQGGSAYTRFANGNGVTNGTGSGEACARNPVSMRTSASITVTNVGSISFGGTALTGMSVDTSDENLTVLALTVSGTPFTANQGRQLNSNNSTATKVEYSAEL